MIKPLRLIQNTLHNVTYKGISMTCMSLLWLWVISNNIIMCWMYYSNLDASTYGLTALYYPIAFTTHVSFGLAPYTAESNFTSTEKPDCRFIVRGFLL